MRVFWTIAGFTALALGVLGIPLPLLPTVPFLLLAAFCFARASDRLHTWLLNHRTFGPPIQDWAASGAISRQAKISATVMITASLGLTLFWGVSLVILLTQIMVLSCVSLFIWSRPEA